MVKAHRHCSRKGCGFSGSTISNEYTNHKHCRRKECTFIGNAKDLKDHIHCLYPKCSYIGTTDDDNIRFAKKGTKPPGRLGFSLHIHCEQCDFVGTNEELLQHYQADLNGHDQFNTESFHLFLRNKKAEIASSHNLTSPQTHF